MAPDDVVVVATERSVIDAVAAAAEMRDLHVLLLRRALLPKKGHFDEFMRRGARSRCAYLLLGFQCQSCDLRVYAIAPEQRWPNTDSK